MSFGVALRNALGLGLGGIATLLTGSRGDIIIGNLLCENDDNLVQEDGGLILLEP
jgi:hypothetical protein